MSGRAMLRVISYDVSDDRRRRKIARLLESVGTRVQYSVFEARLSHSELSRLVARIDDALSEIDSARIYTLGKTSERRSEKFGCGIPIDRGQDHWLF